MALPGNLLHVASTLHAWAHPPRPPMIPSLAAPQGDLRARQAAKFHSGRERVDRLGRIFPRSQAPRSGPNPNPRRSVHCMDAAAGAGRCRPNFWSGRVLRFNRSTPVASHTRHAARKWPRPISGVPLRSAQLHSTAQLAVCQFTFSQLRSHAGCGRIPSDRALGLAWIHRFCIQSANSILQQPS